MAVSSTSNQIIYTGTGSNGPFDFDFSVYETSDLLVQLFEIATQITTDLEETTGTEIVEGEEVPNGDYSVTLNEDGTGHIDTVENVQSTHKLVITRKLPLTQEITYVENDKFPAANHQEGLDRCRMIDQQLQEQIDRCVKVPAGSNIVPDALVEDVAQSVVAAQAAQAAAEAAQGAAETAQGAAETAEKNAETAEANAEAAVASVSLPIIGGSDASKVLTVKADRNGYELKSISDILPLSTILQAVYPVGCTYVSYLSTNPATLFGFGTWVACGVGRMWVGINGADADFDTAAEQGGSKTKNIQHNHSIPVSGYSGYDSGGGSRSGYLAGGSDEGNDYSALRLTSAPASGNGGSTAQDVMNPYEVVYKWKRTA